jgi:hypothetical protein
MCIDDDASYGTFSTARTTLLLSLITCTTHHIAQTNITLPSAKAQCLTGVSTIDFKDYTNKPLNWVFLVLNPWVGAAMFGSYSMNDNLQVASYMYIDASGNKACGKCLNPNQDDTGCYAASSNRSIRDPDCPVK